MHTHTHTRRAVVCVCASVCGPTHHIKYLLKPTYGPITLDTAALALEKLKASGTSHTRWTDCSPQYNKNSSQECIVYMSHLVRYNLHFIIATIEGECSPYNYEKKGR